MMEEICEVKVIKYLSKVVVLLKNNWDQRKEKAKEYT